MAPTHSLEEQSLRERVQGLITEAADVSTWEGATGGAGAMQQQLLREKFNVKIRGRSLPQSPALISSHRKDLSVVVGSAENISWVISTARAGEKKPHRSTANPWGTTVWLPPPKRCWE